MGVVITNPHLRAPDSRPTDPQIGTDRRDPADQGPSSTRGGRTVVWRVNDRPGRRADRSGAGRKGHSRAGERVRDPDPFGGRPPIEQIEIRQKTYVTAMVQPLDVTGVRTVTVGTVALGDRRSSPCCRSTAPCSDDRRLVALDLSRWVRARAAGLEYCRRRAQHWPTQPPTEVETSPLGAAGL